MNSKWLTAPLIAAAGMGMLMLPGALRLPHYQATSLDGATSVADAARLCGRTGLEGWELVTFAQRLTARKFAIYSTLNLWDTPSRAFTHGLGYCTQYNLALREILQQLGFQTEIAFALKVRIFDNEAWHMGHTWLRVTVDGEARDVCAGRLENEPGQVHFVPLSRVHRGGPFTLFLTHLGLIGFMGVLEWQALLTGAAPPVWAYREKQTNDFPQREMLFTG